MTESQNSAKKYLERAYHIDQRINSKILQINSFEDTLKKITPKYTVEPSKNTHNVHRMEDTIVTICFLKNELNAIIDNLVNIKREVMDLINQVDNVDYQVILELRYLTFMKWKDIATEMHYSKDYVFELHEKALDYIYLLITQ